MTVTLDPTLEAALHDEAQRQGVDAETLAVKALRARFLAPAFKLEPQDEWERKLLALGMPCGAGLSDKDVSSEGIYD